MAATGGAVGRALGIGAAVCAALTVASVVALGVVQDQLDQGVTHATIVSSRESADYAAWKDPKRIRTSFYVFNVSNADRLPFGESPVFTEHGPFVYESLKTKLDPAFDRAADSVTYFERNWFRFRRDLSVADDSFEFTTLNIPFWGVVANARSLGAERQKFFDTFLVKEALHELGWTTNGTHLYSMTRSVRAILFGYADDPLLSALQPLPEPIPQDYPGLQNNESAATARQQGPLRARIGAHDPSVISHLDMWNNQTVISVRGSLHPALSGSARAQANRASLPHPIRCTHTHTHTSAVLPHAQLRPRTASALVDNPGGVARRGQQRSGLWSRPAGRLFCATLHRPAAARGAGRERGPPARVREGRLRPAVRPL